MEPLERSKQLDRIERAIQELGEWIQLAGSDIERILKLLEETDRKSSERPRP